ncbi:MAG: LytTR family DNA-binding domain-containing protein [Acidobacteriota bacterium]
MTDERLTAVLVEDELEGQETLRSLLECYCADVEVTATATGVKEACEVITRESPAIVFLDVQLEDGTGLDVLHALPELDAAVIFTTAWDRHALEAMRLAAVDYLLKPIDPTLLEEAVERARQRHVDQRLRSFRVNLREAELQDRRIALPISSGYSFVQLSEILRLSGEDNYTRFHLTDEREYLVARTLKEHEEMLARSGFLRVHKSHVVNLRHVRELHRESRLVLSDGSSIEVARRRRPELLARLSP